MRVSLISARVLGGVALAILFGLGLPGLPAVADDLMGGDDLGSGAELDSEIDQQVVGLLKKARKLLDRRKYAEARVLIDEADDLAPMDDRVLDLLDVVGRLESEEEGARKVLAEIEAEQAEKEKENQAAGQGMKAILVRHGLPRGLPKATARLAGKLTAAEDRIAAAEKARDKCLAGATLSHAAAGARQCRPVEEKLATARKEAKLLDQDLASLDEFFAKKKGKKALVRLRKQQKR